MCAGRVPKHARLLLPRGDGTARLLRALSWLHGAQRYGGGERGGAAAGVRL